MFRACCSFVCLLATLLAAGCRVPRPASESMATLLPGLDFHHRPVLTRSADAQRFFDQGYALYQAFNHEEAARSFAEAARLDPACAMAYWGLAIAAGPNINNPSMDEKRSRAAQEAVTRAVELSKKSFDVERELIVALSKRYVWPPPQDRSALDLAYANAMREVYQRHPNHPDVGALFAESLLTLRPWDQWGPDGEPRPGTPEVLAVLEAVLAAHPDHPFANHCYIHAVEASPRPERGLAAADTLRRLGPGPSHLNHMPAHIDIRLGRYADAIIANQRAIESDRRYVAVAGRQGFYSMYRAHNYHFLVYAAMFEGRSALALQAARELMEELPVVVVRALPEVLEGFLATPLHVLVRFGLWEKILQEPEPEPGLPITRATWHYARGLATAALGRQDAALRERSAFDRALHAVPETYFLGNNPARDVLEVARVLLDGEIEYRAGNVERAFTFLREAVRRDNTLRYDEPWGWPQPPGHALGALLLEQSRIEEAEQVYRQDLARHPNNGWSLHGLAECLRRSGQTAAHAAVETELARAWARADVTLSGSCFCRLGAP